MDWRTRAATVAAAVVIVIGLGAAPVFGAWKTIPAAIVVAGLVGVLIAGPPARRLQAYVTGAAGFASLAATGGILATGAHYVANDRTATAWALAEMAALFLVTLLAVRVASARAAALAASMSGLAIPAWLLRFGWAAPTADMLGGYAAWMSVAVLAAAVGLYLRDLDSRRRQSIADARRAQRDQLARDLHDFVAHDISGMLAQAQAGQILAERNPAAAADAFRRIEEAGVKALAAMDQTVTMLHDAEVTPPTLFDLPDVVGRFAATGTVDAHLDIDPHIAADQLPRDITTTAYRVVVEALTNVRRHAPAADEVQVQVNRTTPTPGIRVLVADNGESQPTKPNGRCGGYGLQGLTERVEALGGNLVAGTAESAGWQVSAFLPLDRGERRSHG